MKKQVLRYAMLFLLLATSLEGCAVINTMVSLKYETDYPGSTNACVSGVTGDDLCASLKHHKIAVIGCFIGFAASFVAALAAKDRE